MEKVSSRKSESGGELANTAASRAPQRTEQISAHVHELSSELTSLFPCVLYQSDRSLHLSYITENVKELLGIPSRAAVQNPLFWDQVVFPEDLTMFAGKLEELQISGSAVLIHRMLDTRELPVWVSHRMRLARDGRREIIFGSLTSIGADSRVHGLDSSAISRFVHKIGNQFQLINLVSSSLARALPDSRDVNLLQEAVDRAIDLVRTFADYSQVPACLPHMELSDVIKGAIIARRPLFQQKGVELKESMGESLDEATLAGDPFLLETAIGHILQNALEATQGGGVVSLVGSLDSHTGYSSVAKLRISDTGCGIDRDNVAKVTVPFFTSKKDHDGLGLSLTSRFVELHGGSLKIRSAVGRGTEVEISLPVITSKKDGL